MQDSSFDERKIRIFQPTIKKAFRIKSDIIILNFFSEEYLFQIIRMDKEVKIKIIVQANTINEFEGVQTGRLIVLYHDLPASAK